MIRPIIKENTNVPCFPSPSFNSDSSSAPNKPIKTPHSCRSSSSKNNVSSQSLDYNTFLQQKDSLLKGFSIIHLNVQSLRAKHELIECLLLEINNFDLLCFSETWLTINNFQCYNFSNYTHIPSIRNNRNGGTSIFIKNNIEYKIREDIKSNLWKDYIFEIAIIEVNNANDKGFLVACIYRTPDSPIQEFFTCLDILLEKAITENKKLIIGGDFNIDLLTKNTNTQDFLTILETNNFIHLINQPTRVSNQTSTSIDNFIVNNTIQINSTGVLEIDISDHYAIYADFNIHKNNREKMSRYSYYGRPRPEKGNLEFVNYISKEKWTPVYNNRCTNNKYNNFINTFSGYMNICFPTKKLFRKKENGNPWYTMKLKKLNSVKHSLYKLKKGNENLKPIYNKFNAYYTRTVKATKHRYYQELFNKNKNNPKKTWQSLNKLAGRTKNITEKPMQLKDAHLITNPELVAEHMNNYFCNIGTSLGLDHSPSSSSASNIQHTEQLISFALFPITETEVVNTIMTLKPNKSPGFDDIPSELLKLSINHISKVLQHIFNASFENGIFPSRMKIAKVIPIHKKGNHLDVNNYRPISLLPVLSKSLERIMFNRLTSYITRFNLVTTIQFGFQKGKSTTDAIATFLNKLNDHLHDSNVISILCDLSKAFDCVNHTLLLAKLSHIGIRGIPLKWFQSYLEDRYQYTVITKYAQSKNEMLATKVSSELKNVTRGVPQGSILGPLLFNIYINDLPNSSTICDFILYADDTNILLSDKNMQTLENKFKAIMDSTNTWFKNNQLVINNEKTKYLHFTNTNTSSLQTHINVKSIIPTNEGKFLGITITSNLSWESHITQVANKIKPGIAMLYKIRDLVNETALLQVYHALIQSHVSYGILLWGGAPQ